jgi:fermentation-respiration switch protein FrsA (DUF1100 family)
MRRPLIRDPATARVAAGRIVLAGCLALGLAGCGGAPANTGSPATGSPATAEPVAGCINARQQAASGVEVPSSEGGTITTLVFGTGSTGIVFANMSDGDLCQWLDTAQQLSRRGYRTAVFNYSATDSATDVFDVVGELRRRGSTRIALVGASMGGTSVLGAAARTPVAAVVELSAPQIYGPVDAVEAIKKITAPTWLAVGDGDADFVPSAQLLYKTSKAPVKHLEVVSTTEHGTGLLTIPSVEPKMLAFLTTYAPPTGG